MQDLAFYTERLKSRDCKDARDRVFALRGFLSESAALVIKPGYTKNVKTVYTEFAREMLRAGNVEILYHAGLWKRKPSLPATWPNYLPSWVPDYRKETTLAIMETKFGSYLRHDPVVQPEFDVSLQPFQLGTKATLIDIVTFVHHTYHLYDTTLLNNDIALFLKIRELGMTLYAKVCTDFQEKHFQYPAGGNCVAALAHALVGGGSDPQYRTTFGTRNNGTPFTPWELWEIYERQVLEPEGELFQAMKQEAAANMVRPPGADSRRGVSFEFYNGASVESGTAWDYVHHLAKVLRRHSIFMTDDGYIGLGPPQTMGKGSESVAFIDGANVPFVLTETKGSGGDWALVGPCYLHGVMDGDAARRNVAFQGGRGDIRLV